MKKWRENRSTINRITNNNKIVRFLFEQMHKQKVHECDFSERVGFHRDTIRGWRCKYQPRINDIETCLDYLGYRLKVVPKEK